MANRKETDAWRQSDFYRQSYHKFLNWIIVDAIIILCLVVVVIYLVFHQNEPPYYASTLSGQILPLIPR